METVLPYLLNCFWLLVPVFVWNILFYKKLPRPYQNEIWDKVPKALALAENILRILVFVLPLLLRLEIKSPIQRAGLAVYLAGLAVYLLSWILAIRSPGSRWSQSVVGFTAPAWTSILWLAGIGLIGQNPTPPGVPYSCLVYLGLALAFTAVHTAHGALVFKR